MGFTGQLRRGACGVACLVAALPAGARAEGHRIVTLAEVTERAMSLQPQLHQARAATTAAEGRVEQARAGYLPQVTASAAYQRATGNYAPRPGALPASGANVPSGNFNTYDYFNFGLTATQLIYDFGQTNGRWSAAESSVDALKATERVTRAQVLTSARTAFYQARAQKALVQVAVETLANQQKHLTQIEGFARAGTRPEIDLYQARTDVATSRVALIQAQNNYEVAKAQLNLAMGVTADTAYDVADDELPPVDGEDKPLEALVGAAVKERPELTALARQRDAQEKTLRAIRGSYGPTLSASTTGNVAGIQLGNLVPNWNIGATLAWPLYQGGLTLGQVHEAAANLDGINAQVDAERLQVRLDVDQARLAVGAAKESIVAADEALANARERLKLAEGRYTAGVGNAIELGDAQLALASAAAQAVQARYNLGAARAQLLSALGRP